MKVILKDDVKKLGSMGQIVEVSDGYARNYLIPRGFAVEANMKNIKSLEHEKKIIQEKSKKIKFSARDIADKLEKTTLIIKVKAGEEGKLFGSVTTMDIAEQLKERGFDIDKKRIFIEEPIKRIGTYPVNIKLHSEVTAQINVEVVQE